MLELAEKVGNSICASGLDLREKDVAKRGLLLGSLINEEVWDAGLSSGLDLTVVEFKAVAACAARGITMKRHDPKGLR